MSYKTILVHVDESRHALDRMEFAANMAMNADAHLIGAATTGMPRRLMERIAFDPTVVDLDRLSVMLRERASRALDRFEDIARRIGLASFESRLVEEGAAMGIAVHARYCDLLIVSQTDPHDNTGNEGADFPEAVVLGSGCPVLILPHAHRFESAGQRILVAWNASPEARKAVHFALPLLERAHTVEVAVFNPESLRDSLGDNPGADIALYLARHGVKVDVLRRAVKSDTGGALVSLSDELDSDLIVMGCYGHGRMRELVLGGATRTVLNAMTCPVLMAH